MELVVHDLNSDKGAFARMNMLSIPGSKDRNTGIKKTSHDWRLGNMEI